jgi:hypothetical protein
MQFSKLGDAFDHWKGSLLGYIRGAGEAVPLVAVPMFTEYSRTTWTAEWLALNARFLGLSSPNMLALAHRPFIGLRKQRSQYFDDLCEELTRRAQGTSGIRVDVFLDPNTGIRAAPTSSANHVTFAEAKRLAKLECVRFVAVYDQSRDRRSDEPFHCQSLAALLGEHELFPAVCSCLQVRMVFVTKDPQSYREACDRLALLYCDATDKFLYRTNTLGVP